jgi:hypothetical protein
MIVEHGKGVAVAPTQQNVGMRWGDDVRGILSAEEGNARRVLRQVLLLPDLEGFTAVGVQCVVWLVVPRASCW